MEKLLDHSQHHHYFSVPATQHHLSRNASSTKEYRCSRDYFGRGRHRRRPKYIRFNLSGSSLRHTRRHNQNCSGYLAHSLKAIGEYNQEAQFRIIIPQPHEQKSGPRYQSQNELGSGYGKTGLSDTVNTAKQGSPLEEKSLAYSSTREVHDESEAVQTVINCINRLNTNKKHRYLSGELKSLITANQYYE